MLDKVDSSSFRPFTCKIIVPVRVCLLRHVVCMTEKCVLYTQTAADEYLFRVIQVQFLECGIH